MWDITTAIAPYRVLCWSPTTCCVHLSPEVEIKCARKSPPSRRTPHKTIVKGNPGRRHRPLEQEGYVREEPYLWSKAATLVGREVNPYPHSNPTPMQKRTVRTNTGRGKEATIAFRFFPFCPNLPPRAEKRYTSADPREKCS